MVLKRRIVQVEPDLRFMAIHVRGSVCWLSRDDLPGLVAQGRTIQETLEIARDVGKRLLEARKKPDYRSPNVPCTYLCRMLAISVW